MEQHLPICPAFAGIPAIAERYGVNVDIVQLLVMVLAYINRASSRTGASATSPAGNASIPSKDNGDITFHASPEDILQLKSHSDKYTPEFKADVRACMTEVLKLVKTPLNEDDRVDVVQLLGTLNTNMHGDPDDLIFGLFPGLSMLCHSCDPNCVYTINNGTVTVRTSRRVDSQEELSISYIYDLGMSRWRRRNILLQHRFFHCACARCVREESGSDFFESFRCANSKCSGLVRVPTDDQTISADQACVI